MELLDNITKSEDTTADVYSGTREALITAGLVRAEQFPPDGTLGISYYSGTPSKKRGVIDENYFRVEFVQKTWRVRVGVPQNIARARTIAANKARHARWSAQQEAEHEAKSADKRKGEAEYARRLLKELPRTADSFRRNQARSMRDWIQIRLRLLRGERNGLCFDPDSIDAIGMAADAVVDAIMAADVKLDIEQQQLVIASLQVQAMAGEPSIVQKIAKLMRANASLLTGDPS